MDAAVREARVDVSGMHAAGHGRVIHSTSVGIGLAAHAVLRANADVGESAAGCNLVTETGARFTQYVVGTGIVGLSAGVGDAAPRRPQGPGTPVIQGGDPGAKLVE